LNVDTSEEGEQPSMDIKTGEPEIKMLDEYDFCLTNGNILPITP
jgi:hypothetical protein